MENPRGDRGFTVIEFSVAMSLLVVSLFAAAHMLTSGMRVSGDTRARIVATNLATQTLEQIRGSASNSAEFTSIVIGRSTATQQIGAITYTITKDVGWVGQRADSNNCDAGSGATETQILRATAVITWPNMNGTAPVESTTTLSPPVGAYSATSGAISTQVLDAHGVPVPFATATASGVGTPVSVVTGDDGCAFFAFLPTGTYTVSLAKAGYVGSQQVVSPSQTASVTAGQTSALTFDFDQAASMTTTFSGLTPATNIKVSVANTALQPNGAFSYAVGTTTLSPLYPFTTGYTVFAGSCTDANPLGLNTTRNRFYPTAAPVPVVIDPAATGTGTAPLYPLSVLAVNTSNVGVSNATVTITSTASTAGGACTGGTPTYNLPNTGSGTPTALGTSSAGVPLGHYTITATSGSKSGTQKIWVKPDGTYAVDTVGNSTTLFAGPVAVTVK